MRIFVVFAVLLAVVIQPVRAQGEAGTVLPDMVITATRVPTPVADIPAGVTIIDRATMDNFGETDLVQALSATPGIRAAQSGGTGGNASVFIRGLNSNQVLVLRDGMPINDAADSSGAFNFGVDTLADVERIEVIRGPMAALYGSGAIAGVINLITRKGTVEGTQFSASLAGGYPRQIQGNAVATGRQDGWDYALVAEGQAQQGFDSVPQRMRIYRDVPQGYQSETFTLNAGYTPVEGTRLSLLLRARSAAFGFNALGSPTFDNDNSTGRADSLLGRIGATTKLWDGSWDSGVYVGRLQEDRSYREALNPRDPNLQTNDSRYHAYRTDVQWNNTFHLNDHFDSTALSATDLTFGAEHTADTVNVGVDSSFAGFP